MIAATLVTAALVAGVCAAEAPPPAPRADAAAPADGPADVRLEGDVTYEPGTGRLLVQNGATLRRGDVVIRARSFTYDPATGEVRASGGVLLTDRTRVVAADAIRAIVDGPWEASGVVAFVKGAPVDLSGAADVEQARRLGPNRFSFRGDRLRGDPSGAFRLEGARLTLCDCPGGGAPSWELATRRADVVPGKRAILSWPVLRVTPRFLGVDRPVPVFAFPWLYLPLGERQTGLLLPEVESVQATGLRLAQPLFVTLGRSADLTLTPEWALGRARADVREGKPAVRGPGGRLEARWAPAAGTEGRLEIAAVDDLDAEPGGEDGGRFALEGAHAQRLSPRTGLFAALRLAGDPLWARDFAATDLAPPVPYLRSDVLLSHRRDAAVLEAGASFLEPLRPFGVVAGEEFGALGAGLDGASRLPGATATLLPAPLGPLRVSGRAALVRWAPPSGDVDVEGGRPAADRADGQLQVALPVLLGRALSFTPWARGGAAAYAFEDGGRSAAAAWGERRGSATAAWGVAGATLGTEVSRRFGALRHAVAPRLEWRGGTGASGDRLPFPAYDAFDRDAAGALARSPSGPWSQLRAAVETRLATPGADVVRVEVGQDYDLRAGRFGETFVVAGASAGRLSAEVAARFLALDDRAVPAPEPEPDLASDLLDRFTELRAGVAVSDRRGDALRASFFSVGPGGSGRLLAGLDPLFDLRPAGAAAAGWATAGARLVAGPASLTYDAVFPGRPERVASCTGAGTRVLEGWQVKEHAASLAWDSPCRCFRIAAVVRVNDCGELSGYDVVLDLSGVGRSLAAR